MLICRQNYQERYNKSHLWKFQLDTVSTCWEHGNKLSRYFPTNIVSIYIYLLCIAKTGRILVIHGTHWHGILAGNLILCRPWCTLTSLLLLPHQVGTPQLPGIKLTPSLIPDTPASMRACLDALSRVKNSGSTRVSGAYSPTSEVEPSFGLCQGNANL